MKKSEHSFCIYDLLAVTCFLMAAAQIVSSGFFHGAVRLGLGTLFLCLSALRNPGNYDESKAQKEARYHAEH